MSLFPVDELGSEALETDIQEELSRSEFDGMTPSQIDQMDAQEYSDYLAAHKEFDL